MNRKYTNRRYLDALEKKVLVFDGAMGTSLQKQRERANTACTRPLGEHQDYSGGSLRVFRHSVRLEVGSGKVALSRPAHQRVTPAVGRQIV